MVEITVTGNNTNQDTLTDGSDNQLGLWVDTDFPAIGDTMTSISFFLSKQNSGSVSGNLSCKWYNSSDVLVNTSDSIAKSTLTTSPVSNGFTFSGGTVALNDKFLVSEDTYDSGNKTQVQSYTTCATGCTGTAYAQRKADGTMLKHTSPGFWLTFGTPSSGGTLLPPPIAHVRL